jgi:succinate dehydrogenase / fumarate reductase cytochrome b subunit
MSAVTASISRFYDSSVGKKILVALTGGVFILFVLGHMLGNLQVFLGPEVLNNYAHKLQSLGPLLWLVRIFLLVTIATHIILTVQLTRQNRAARESRYGFNATIQASKPSRIMIWSGLTVLAFIIYHLLHFTAGVANGYRDPNNARYFTELHGERVQNCWQMVVDGFSWAPASIFYITATVLLCNHLAHGFGSMFQTLGITTEKNKPLIQKAGAAFAFVILIGNCSIPVAIWLFGYGS